MSVRTVTQTMEMALTRLENNEADLRELDSRYYLIDPVLRALKWDLSDPAQVKFECQMGDGRIDYVLFNRKGNPAVYMEAKRADSWLTDENIVQLREYVQRRKQGLAVLTNGTEWKIYDLSRRGRFDSERGKKLADIYFDLPDRFSEEDEWSEETEETTAMSVGEVAKILYQCLDKQRHW